jgi:hypothetical protein
MLLGQISLQWYNGMYQKVDLKSRPYRYLDLYGGTTFRTMPMSSRWNGKASFDLIYLFRWMSTANKNDFSNPSIRAIE